MEVKPSLWAALDTLAKIVLIIAATFVPVLIGLLLEGDSLTFFGALAAFFTFEGAGIWYGIVAAFFPMIQLAFTRYIVDEEGIRIRVQILSKSERRVSWDKVTMLQHRRTLMDRLLGLHRLDLLAYGERGTTFHLVGLRSVESLRARVAHEMEAHASMGALND